MLYTRFLYDTFIYTLNLYDSQILRKSETKFLDMIINDTFFWKPNVNFMKSKISRMIGVLFKLNKYLITSAMKNIYYSLIFPHLQYGIIFWSGINKTKFLEIFRLQKKIVRIIGNSDRFEHSEPIFKRFNILKLEDVKRLEYCKFISNDINIHDNFNFRPRTSVHAISTRNSSALILPLPRTNILLHSVFYEGIKNFNDLPLDLKSASGENKFKYMLKSFLLNQYND